MPAPGLILSVILFLGCSTIGFIILILRRVFVKGELGGSNGGKYASAAVFFLLWVVYVILSGLGTYQIIDLDSYIRANTIPKAPETFSNLFEELEKRLQMGQ